MSSMSKSHQLLTNEILEVAFKADLGQGSKLTHFEIKDFTKKGDNYICVVTGVKCDGTCNGLEKTAYYVAKLNPFRLFFGAEDTFTNGIFEKEGGFLTDVAPILNKIMLDIGHSQINFPESVYFNMSPGKEILILRDLRVKGYKMFDKNIGMDFEHSKLLVRELAKLHSSSVVFKSRLGNKTPLDIYPYLADKWGEATGSATENLKSFILNNIDISLRIITDNKEYEKQYKWMKNLKPQIFDLIQSMLRDSPESMKVIGHGDCWNNNVVFRYDDKGNPLAITLLDLQVCRFGSLALDLNCFFYTSLTGQVRHEYHDQLLAEYYDEFCNVMKVADMNMPFTLNELHKEVQNKILFGIIFGLMVLPLLMCENENTPDFSDLNKDSQDECYKDFSDRIMKLSDSSSVFSTRFMTVWDDVAAKGIMDDKPVKDPSEKREVNKTNKINESTSHEALTRSLLETTFKNDLGQDWNLAEFEVKDFTQKGDNYMTIITGVSCTGSSASGLQKTTNYVAKISPERPSFGDEHFMNEAFETEGSFLTELAPKLNGILVHANHPQINFPEPLYLNLKCGSEILITRDLRCKGYKMFDKHIGMNFDHSKLVVRELAKLHSSSVVFKNRLKDKNVVDIYPYMIKQWTLSDKKNRDKIESFVQSSVTSSLRMIRHNKKYEKQYNWMNSLKNKALDIYIKNLETSPECMRVICHGDCWNNNVLFRYDNKENPMATTLLDLQQCTFSSLAIDLNYFFYTSLTGSVRDEHHDQLLTEYYDEFSNVMKAVNMKIPFTFDELMAEVFNKTIFGILGGIMVLPLILCESEFAPDLSKMNDENAEEMYQRFSDSILKLSNSSPVFNTRFMTLWDDVETKGLMNIDLFSGSDKVEESGETTAPNPKSLLTKERVELAFKADMGQDWSLIDFEIKDFVKKGDNYATVVTGVSCNGTFGGTKKKTQYVAKLNPFRAMLGNDDPFTYNVFEKEGRFLTQVAPMLNQILKDLHHSQINFPETLHFNLVKGSEVLITRDLRLKGYKMVDKHVGMDLEHSKLLVRELAKLHSASVVFKNRLENQTVLDVYPYMVDMWISIEGDSKVMVETFILSTIDISLRMISHNKEYQKQYNWMKNHKPKLFDSMCELIRNGPESMRVICHGDCWNNNVLFRYDDEGHPLSITLLDLQLCRFGSLALDLNYFFYTSLSGELRNKYLDQILTEYYDEFSIVMKAAQMETPFTMAGLSEEVFNKTFFGVINGLMILPLILCESESAPDFSQMDEENMEDVFEKFSDSIMRLSNSSPVFNTRFMTVWDDVKNKGLMDDDRRTN